MAVAYIRYSSDQQQDGFSLEAQTHAIKEYAKANNIIISKFYVDEAYSARTADRPQFQQMIKDAKARKFNMVLVHKYDRFARDTYDSVTYRKVLKDNNVKLVATAQIFDEDKPEDRLFISILEGFAQYYSDNLSQETIKGIQERAKKGMHHGGPIPYGYNSVDGKLVINEEEAQVVRLAYTYLRQGFSIGKIAQKFNDEQIPYRNRPNWGRTSVLPFFTHPRYYGTFTFCVNTWGATHGTTKSDPVVIENAIDPIVTAAEFMEAQSLIEKAAIKKRRLDVARRQFLLTGYLYSVEEPEVKYSGGSSYKYHPNGDLRNIKYYYRVDARNTKKLSTLKHIDQDKLEQLVVDSIMRDLLCEENIRKVAPAIVEYKNTVPDKSADNQLKIDNLNVKKARLLDAYTEGLIDKLEFAAKRTELDLEISKLAVNISPSAEPCTLDDVVVGLKELADNFPDANNSDIRGALFDMFIRRIEISKDLIYIYYNPNFLGAHTPNEKDSVYNEYALNIYAVYHRPTWSLVSFNI